MRILESVSKNGKNTETGARHRLKRRKNEILSEVKEHLPGDLDGSLSVDLSDAILALKVLSGMNPAELVTPYALSGSDVDGDLRVGIEEAAYILEDVAGLR